MAPWSYERAHSLLGIVTVNVIAGLTVTLAWLLLLHAPVIDLAPVRVRSRIAGPRPIPAREWLLTVPALALGAATHIVWDELTHDGRWGDRHVSWLAHNHVGLAGYKWGQYLSGLLGAAIIAVYWWRWWTIRPVCKPISGIAPADRRALRVTAAVGLTATIAITGGVHLDEGLHPALYSALHDAGPAVSVVVLLTASGWHGRRRHQARRETRTGQAHREQ